MHERADNQARPDQLQGLGRFLNELSRRRVWKTAIAYAAVVFVLLQVGEIVFPAFGAPDWSLRLLVVVSFLGFPLVLALAWVFDITPEGVHRTETSATQGPEVGKGSTFPRVALLAITLAIVGGVGWWSVKDTLEAGTVAGAGGAGTATTPVSIDSESMAVHSLAVLPLEDFSQEEGGGFFTAGFHDELISQLGLIGAAKVISRTSVVQYDRTGKAMPAIAADLGVDGVVEGSVFRAGNQVRITVQLIHGPTDQHLWAESYEGTMDDPIALQAEVAKAVAEAIRDLLFPASGEESRTSRLARGSDARSEYMRGRYDLTKATPEALTSAAQHYEAALAEDSGFAPAYAGLAATRFLLNVRVGDSVAPAPVQDPQVIGPLQHAFQIDRSSPEATAVVVAIREATGEMPMITLPEGIELRIDSALAMDGMGLAASEFGRELTRVVASREGSGESHRGLSDRMAQARELQLEANYAEAEQMIRSIVVETPATPRAWDALERLQTNRSDFQGFVEVRRDRLEQTAADPEDLASLEELETILASTGEAGFWSWRLSELQARAGNGEEVSPVELARAYVGVGLPAQALPLVREAVEEKDENLISLWTDPAWDTLRNDSEFRSLLRELRRGGGPLDF